jgi:Peptidase A4 family
VTRNFDPQGDLFQMIRRKTLAIALLALGGLAAAPCAAGDVAQLPSGNWSGYAIRSTPVGQLPPSTTFTVVRARWRQPTVICTTPNARTAIWVGLDGTPKRSGNAGTVEQVGTTAECGSDPTATTPLWYRAWWEMKAEGLPVSPGKWEFDVSPGDLIEATVTYSDGGFVLHVEDRTTRRSFTTTPQTCDPAHICPRVSAEFIVERPGEPSGPLGNYGSVVFNDLLVRASSNQKFQWAKETMQDSNTIMSSCGARFEENLDEPFLVLPLEIGCEWKAATP